MARTFDSIGRRNEGLRTHLDAIEFSFRNIEAIRSQFYEALTPIDQTLVEIERTKSPISRRSGSSRPCTRRTSACEASTPRSRSNATGSPSGRRTSGRVKDLEQALGGAEAAASEARAALADRREKLERTERELEDNSGA